MLTKKTALTTALIVVLGSASLGTAAMARDHGGEGRGLPSFSDLDTNGDGQVSVAELEAVAAARFAAVDTNGDGLVSAEELTARASADASERAERRATRMIDRMDENDDGALSIDEMTSRGPGAERMVERLDENGDGMISEEEFAEAAEKRGKRGGKRGHGKRGGEGRGN